MPRTYEHLNRYEREMIAQMLKENIAYLKLAIAWADPPRLFGANFAVIESVAAITQDPQMAWLKADYS